MAEERLQKLIARSGLCSRRAADQMVLDGRVTVNGRVARVGDTADPDRDHVRVDGKALKPAERHRYVLLYKPREVMSTCQDPEERTTVLDFVRSVIRERVFPVGRLDYHSEGLLILTNDGELAARVAHPRHGVVREYLAKIKGDLTPSEHRKLMTGVRIEGQPVRPLRAQRERVTRDGRNSWWRIQVREGRTHEVRELFFRAGHHVQRLKRTAIGPIRDVELRPGDFRELTSAELRALRKATGQVAGRRSGDKARRPRTAPGKPRK